MKRPQDIALQQNDMATIVGLTSAFESLASMRISQTKTQVQRSKEFFAELWQMYSQLRVDSLFRYGRGASDDVNPKSLLIAVTAEGGFSGDIDQKLITLLLKDYNPAKQELVVVGHHGANQLEQQGIKLLKVYKLPEKDDVINVEPLVGLIRRYSSATVYYQTYVSLTVQDVKRSELNKAVQIAGRDATHSKDIIDESTYIFEPDAYAVVAHLERSMLEITLSQVILESKLAQYASRFRAMTTAHERASDSLSDLRTLYNRTKRMISDERMKEVMNGRKQAQAVQAL